MAEVVQVIFAGLAPGSLLHDLEKQVPFCPVGAAENFCFQSGSFLFLVFGHFYSLPL